MKLRRPGPKIQLEDGLIPCAAYVTGWDLSHVQRIGSHSVARSMGVLSARSGLAFALAFAFQGFGLQRRPLHTVGSLTENKPRLCWLRSRLRLIMRVHRALAVFESEPLVATKPRFHACGTTCRSYDTINDGAQHLTRPWHTNNYALRSRVESLRHGATCNTTCHRALSCCIFTPSAAF